MKVSIVLDRRSFVTGAALAAGAVAVTVRSALPFVDTGASAGESTVDSSMADAGASADWAVDHIFGTYPPYAHPIPYGRQFATDVSPMATPIDAGRFDPFLMI
jgi:hypothetical protein